MTDRQPDRKTVPPPAEKSAGRASAAPRADARRKHTLAAVIALVGRVDDATVRGFVASAARDVVALGGRAATKRIVRDGVRLVGEASDFLREATPEQQAQLPGASDQFLAATATALERATHQQGALDAQKTSARAQRSASTVALEAAMEKARGRREVLYSGSAVLAGCDPELRGRLDRAYGTAADGAEAATSLDAMVPVARELMQDAAKRGVQSKLTEAFLAESLQVAEAVRVAAEEAAAAAVRGGVTQSAVDWWDGAALWFLQRLLESFDAGHRADPTIPRLQVVALRAVLRKPTGKYVMATTGPRSHGCIGGSRWQPIHPRRPLPSWAAAPTA